MVPLHALFLFLNGHGLFPRFVLAAWGCLNSGCPSPQQGGCIWWLHCAGLCSVLAMWLLAQSWGGLVCLLFEGAV